MKYLLFFILIIVFGSCKLSRDVKPDIDLKKQH